MEKNMSQSENYEEDDYLDDLERDKKVRFNCLIKATINGDPFDLIRPSGDKSIIFNRKRCKVQEITVTKITYEDWN